MTESEERQGLEPRNNEKAAEAMSSAAADSALSFKPEIREDLAQACKNAVTLIARILILSIVLAYLMSLVENLRLFGMGSVSWPFSTLGDYHPPSPGSSASDSLLLGYCERFIYLLNCAFPGGSRLGSTIGTLAASYWTLYTTPRYGKLQRCLIGILAGSIIGFRGALVITSFPNLCLAASIISSILFAIYMLRSEGAEKIPDLPPLPVSQ